MLEASMLFQDVGCGAVPVVDAGQPIGILTDRDVALAVANNPDLGNLPVADFMSKDIFSVGPDVSLEEVGARLGRNSVRRLMVIDAAGHLQGIIALSDLAPHVSEQSLGHFMNQVMAET
jgi:CBS domain-containing protein